MEKPVLKLSETDGNVYAIIGKAIKCARRHKWPQEKIDKMSNFCKNAQSYDDVLDYLQDQFDVI